MKIRMTFIILSSAAVCLAAQTEEIREDNLKTLLESRNARIAAAKMDVEAAAEREGSFARSFLPEIEVYGQQETFKKGRQDSKSQPAYGAQASLNLFNGGRDSLQSQVRTLETEKKTFQFRRIQAEELEKVRTLYWNILYTQARLELMNEMSQVNSQNLKAAERRIRSGIATESDRVEFEMKSVELAQEEAETKLRLSSYRRELALALGFDNADSLRFPQQMDHEHEFEASLLHAAADHEFLYKEHELQSEASSLESRSFKRSWVPRLDAFAAYNQYNQREEDFPDAADRTESTVGLRVTLSLGGAFEASREARSLRKTALSARTLADLQKKEVEIHISNEMNELKLLHDQVHAAEENTQRAGAYYKITQSEYARGVKNSPDVLGASEKLFATKNRHLEILRDFQISKAHVLSKIGK